ncbi:MAG: hypothetical protein IKM25_07230 [Clostridia bacterium]|nr:hypothetical protein [Clostridia bacterium]
MISNLISENEFKQRLALWKLENDIGVYLPSSQTKAEYLEIFRLPDFDLVHYNSYPDENDDLITLLKGEIRLKGWETKNGREPRTFAFYKVLKTVTDSPVLETKTIGYVIL